MLLFPSDVESLLTHLAERLDLDPQLAEACRPLVEQESYQDLFSTAATVLAGRLSQKAGLASDELKTADWAGRIDWGAAGFAPEQAETLTNLCQGVLDGLTFLPATPKTGRALLLLTDVLLSQLDRLPDLAPPEEAPADFDARPFFEELVKSLNALLPYEQRDFPTESNPTRAKLLLPNLPEETYYSVEICPPAGDDPGRIEMGLHFDTGDVEQLARHFRRKIPGLSHSLGGKEIVMEEGDGRLSILLHQPYQPSEKLSAFMTAATLVGFIGSLQERMPRRPTA